jgi:glycosyltransferase involved in cell wall biosynthesis
VKKVLLVGYPFPLRWLGSPRLLGMAKYLPEFGWEPIILSAPLEGKADPRFRIVETGYREALGIWGKVFKLTSQEDIRKQIRNRLGVKERKTLLDSILTLAGEIINYPDSEKGWKPYAIKDGERLLQREKIDAIISTSAPLTAHVIAYKLKSRFKIPWVGDLRDLWTQNHNYRYSFLRKCVDKRLELKTLSAADALVTVSQPWADKLGALHKGKKIYAITNGFDPETLNIPPAKLTKTFTITYTGVIYPGNQDPARLMEALRKLISEGTINPKDVEMRFYGAREPWLEKEAGEYGLANITRQYGQVPREVALQKQRESHVLLLLNWDDPQEKGTYPGKVFEYLAAGRPIIATGGSKDDVVAKLLKETGAGIQATTVEKTISALKEMYTEYKSQGRVKPRGDKAKISKYSQLEMAKKFSEVLNSLT